MDSPAREIRLDVSADGYLATARTALLAVLWRLRKHRRSLFFAQAFWPFGGDESALALDVSQLEIAAENLRRQVARIEEIIALQSQEPTP